jgi:OFA family oxalate/formate antiporter-like MFS transporter
MNRKVLLLPENTNTAGKGRFSIFYGWYIIAAGTLLMATCFGIIYSFSVYFSSLQNEFSWNRAATSGTFSLYLLLVGLFSIICGPVWTALAQGR